MTTAVFIRPRKTHNMTQVFKDNRAREARIPISASCLFNLNDIMQLHKCTQNTKKKKQQQLVCKLTRVHLQTKKSHIDNITHSIGCINISQLDLTKTRSN